MSKKDLKVTLIGEDKTGGAFGSASSGAAKFGKAVGAAALVAGAAVGAFVAKGVKDAIALETAMAEVFTLLPGASKQAMDSMTGDVLKFSSQMGIATTDAVPALYQALSAGVPKENVFAFLEDAGKLGIAGVTDLKTATGVLALAVNNFTGEGLNAADASDLLFTAVRVGTTTMDELSGAVANVGPGAAALGIEFKEVTGALAAMTATSGNAQLSSTQLRAMLGELGKETTVVGKKFKEISGQTFTQFTASGGTLQEALALLGDETAKTGQGAESLFGSVEAGMGVLALTGENASKFTNAMAEMGNSAGATDVAFQTMEQSVSRQWDKLKVQVQNFGIEIGQRLLPLISSAVESMAAAFDRLVAWWAVHGPAISAAAALVGAALMATATQVGAAFSAVVGFLTEHKSVAVATLAVVGTALAAWGVAATINAAKNVAAWAVATAATLKAAAVHTAQVGSMAVKWAFLGAQSLLHAAKVAAAWLIAMGPIGLVIAAVIGLVVVIVKNWDTIRNATAALWEWVKSATSAAWAAVTGAVKAAGAAIVGALTSAWASAKGAVSSGVSAVLSIITFMPRQILGALGNLGGLLVDAGRSIVDGLIRGITGRFGALAAKASELAQKVKNFLPFSPAKEGPFSGKGNPYYSGRSIASLLADGLGDGKREVGSAMGRLTDLADVTGMNVGGTSYVNRRLGITPGGGRNVTVNLVGQVEKLDEDRLVTLLGRAERLAGV